MLSGSGGSEAAALAGWNPAATLLADAERLL
jgi:hypothetical protein